jgi:hypothetical protein
VEEAIVFSAQHNAQWRREAPMRSQAFKERRASPRIKLPHMLAGVTATNDLNGVANPLLGHAYDISSTGVRIELDCPLQPGETVGIHVDLPWNGQQINAMADVIWVNDDEDDPGPRRMALQFKSFGDNMDAVRLDDLMATAATRVAA